MVGATQANTRPKPGKREQPNQRGFGQEGDRIPSEVQQQKDAVKTTQPLSELHPEGWDKRQPASVEPSSGKGGTVSPVVEPQLTTRKGQRDQNTQEQRRVVPEQRAQGNPARPGTLHTQSEGLRPEGDQLARKEAIQNKVLSPESLGEDLYISDRERVKSSSSSGSRRRSDSAKKKTPEAVGVCHPYPNSGRTEGAKKRSKKNSPGRQDQERSRRYNEERRHPTSSVRSSAPNPSRP